MKMFVRIGKKVVIVASDVQLVVVTTIYALEYYVWHCLKC